MLYGTFKHNAQYGMTHNCFTPMIRYYIYIACVYTVVRDVIVEEMHRGSSVVVIATAQSVSSLHPKLLPSRGNHLFRKTIEVSSPNLVSFIV